MNYKDMDKLESQLKLTLLKESFILFKLNDNLE